MNIQGKVRPFRFWSQKILPLVYDDSLSYYEVLSKLCFKLNEVINMVNDNLQDYIRDAIDSLFVDTMYDAETESIIITLEVNSNE